MVAIKIDANTSAAAGAEIIAVEAARWKPWLSDRPADAVCAAAAVAAAKVAAIAGAFARQSLASTGGAVPSAAEWMQTLATKARAGDLGYEVGCWAGSVARCLARSLIAPCPAHTTWTDAERL